MKDDFKELEQLKIEREKAYLRYENITKILRRKQENLIKKLAK